MTRRRPIPVLRGTYTPPALRRGDFTHSLVRDEMLRISSWSDAPISWPRGCPVVQSPGFPSLIVDDELARAVREESAAAIRYWWGVSNVTVIRWRQALGVDRKNNAGSQVLIRAATTRARAAQSPTRSAAYRQKQRDNINRRRRAGQAPELIHGKAWTPEHRALLGTMPDAEVAARTGHPLSSVKTIRRKLRIPSYKSSKSMGDRKEAAKEAQQLGAET